MKKLFLKDGGVLNVTLQAEPGKRTIQVREDDFINYEVSKGWKHSNNLFKLGETTQELKIWELKNALEIYENFEQYWSYLITQNEA